MHESDSCWICMCPVCGLSVVWCRNPKLTIPAILNISSYSLSTHLPPNLEVYTLNIQINLIILGTVALESNNNKIESQEQIYI